MKKYKVLFLTLFFASTLTQGSHWTVKVESGGHVTFIGGPEANATNGTDIQTEVKSATKQDTKQDTDQTATHNTHQNPHLSAAQRTAQQYSGMPQSKTHIGTSGTYQTFLTPKRIFLTGVGFLAASYALLYVTIYQTRKILTCKESWSNWKHELSLEELFSLPRTALARELITHIQARHINKRNPADHIYPMNKFMNDLNKETTILKRYLWITEKTKRINLLRILPGKNLSTIAKNRLERLAYLRTLFFDWAQTHRSKQATQLLGATTAA